jgi:hypothetical protein
LRCPGLIRGTNQSWLPMPFSSTGVNLKKVIRQIYEMGVFQTSDCTGQVSPVLEVHGNEAGIPV